jgi:hypothetical protein
MVDVMFMPSSWLWMKRAQISSSMLMMVLDGASHFVRSAKNQLAHNDFRLGKFDPAGTPPIFLMI